MWSEDISDSDSDESKGPQRDIVQKKDPVSEAAYNILLRNGRINAGLFPSGEDNRKVIACAPFWLNQIDKAGHHERYKSKCSMNCVMESTRHYWAPTLEPYINDKVENLYNTFDIQGLFRLMAYAHYCEVACVKRQISDNDMIRHVAHTNFGFCPICARIPLIKPPHFSVNWEKNQLAVWKGGWAILVNDSGRDPVSNPSANTPLVQPVREYSKDRVVAYYQHHKAPHDSEVRDLHSRFEAFTKAK
jgi:hypothetical protein